MYQKIILIGNLGGDPELRHTGDQTAVCSFSLAVSRRVKSDNGWENKTQWWRVSLFGKRAETANQYLSKGAKVLVEGEISFDHATGGPRIFVRKDGTSGASFEMVASDFSFVGSKADDTQPQAQAKTTPTPTAEVNEDDIPF
jgi:single-strand DNA-binding protein